MLERFAQDCYPGVGFCVAQIDRSWRKSLGSMPNSIRPLPMHRNTLGLHTTVGYCSDRFGCHVVSLRSSFPPSSHASDCPVFYYAVVKAEHASWLTSKRKIPLIKHLYLSFFLGASKNTLSRKKWTPTATGGNPGEKWYQFKKGVLTIHDVAASEPSSIISIRDIISVAPGDPVNPTCSFNIVSKEKTFELLSRTEEDCVVSLD